MTKLNPIKFCGCFGRDCAQCNIKRVTDSKVFETLWWWDHNDGCTCSNCIIWQNTLDEQIKKW